VIDRWQYRFVESTDADFSTFFLKFYRLPYDTWASLDHARFNHVMRFEQLAEDFDAVLRKLGIEPVRRLPIRNTTRQRDRTFESYYSLAARRRAFRIMRPYMERWGYEFPADWEVESPRPVDRARYALYSVFARAYWKHLRPRT
jgi:hypothetical protein